MKAVVYMHTHYGMDSKTATAQNGSAAMNLSAEPTAAISQLANRF
jgi:hypothetical protein